ncbi:hypothetical protein CJU90_3668 [Yarrowia sp. C11]|nr:hypothetical protein CKK34_5278 [Yarrowia sp. E02]KAG5367377.1 hypothetical protein CJU90_3668 [Yarrowia sp. C11]
MELGEKLPYGFEALDGDVIEVQTREVSSWKQRTNNGKYGLTHNPKPEFPYFHLKYLQCIPKETKPEDKFETVCSNEKHTVIKFKPGGESTMFLILPPLLQPVRRRESYDPLPFEADDHTITVRCDDPGRRDGYYSEPTVYVFQRDKPLHFRNAVVYRFNYREITHLRKSLFFRNNQNGQVDFRTYEFSDTQHGIMRVYASESSAIPIALYDGLVWWCYRGTKIFPTFVDLQQPGEVFYRKDKIIVIDERIPFGERDNQFHQCKKPGMERYVLRKIGGGVQVIDLVNATVTNVVNPRKYQTHPYIVMGFVDDKFWAKFLDTKTMDSYEREKLWKTKSIEEDRWGRHGIRFI